MSEERAVDKDAYLMLLLDYRRRVVARTAACERYICSHMRTGIAAAAAIETEGMLLLADLKALDANFCRALAMAAQATAEHDEDCRQ